MSRATAAQRELSCADRASNPRRSLRPIEVSRVSKIYRRYSQRKQFATLKSALLSRSLIANLRPDETFTALNDVSLHGADGTHARRHRPQRLRQEHAAEARRRHHQADRAAR